MESITNNIRPVEFWAIAIRWTTKNSGSSKIILFIKADGQFAKLIGIF
jgi:hypothetical protein